MQVVLNMLTDMCVCVRRSLVRDQNFYEKTTELLLCMCTLCMCVRVCIYILPLGILRSIYNSLLICKIFVIHHMLHTDTHEMQLAKDEIRDSECKMAKSSMQKF